jgi:hypothetical protein
VVLVPFVAVVDVGVQLNAGLAKFALLSNDVFIVSLTNFVVAI